MLSLIAAGVCMVPAAAVMIVTIPLVALLSFPGLALLCYSKPSPPPPPPNNTKKNRTRVIITGGSSGIGLAVAQKCLEQHSGGILKIDEIILLARTLSTLKTAKEMLEHSVAAAEEKKKKLQATWNNVDIKIFSMDVSKPEEIQTTCNLIFAGDDDKDKHDTTTTTYLFCIAGAAYPDYFENISTKTLESMVHINQLGTMYTVQAMLPKIQQGAIVLCSSMAGQVGTFGYCGYSPTKFAIRGFAEALYLECCHKPISISIAFPPDTDTPGFQLENQTKPPQTAFQSEAGGKPAHPQQIAAILVQEIFSKKTPNFQIYFNFDGWMLSSLTAGFGPVTSVGEALSQVAGMGIFRLVSLFYLKSWILAFRAYANAETKKEVVLTPATTKSKPQ